MRSRRSSKGRVATEASDEELRSERNRLSRQRGDLLRRQLELLRRLDDELTNNGGGVSEIVAEISEITAATGEMSEELDKIRARLLGMSVEEFGASLAGYHARMYMPDTYDGPWVICGHWEEGSEPVLQLTNGGDVLVLSVRDAQDVILSEEWPGMERELSSQERVLLRDATLEWLADVDRRKREPDPG